MSLAALTAGIKVNKDKNAAALAFQTGSSKSSLPAASGSAAGAFDFFASPAASSSSSGTLNTSKLSKKSKPKQKAQPVELVSAEVSAAVRKQHKIKVQGEACPVFTDFDQLALPAELAQTLLDNSWNEPTAIQMQAVPLLLQHRDLLACASTGSGKTLAFLLPLLLRHVQHPWSERRLRAIIIEPTRELARQVYAQAEKLSRGLDWNVSLMGGESSLSQTSSSPNPDLLITTPLRLVKCIKDKSLQTDAVETLCFDEADKLFELDFLSQSDQILVACTNPQLRKAMFSATVPSGFEEMVRRIVGVDLVRVIVGHKEAANPLIRQELKFCATEEGKLATLKGLITEGEFVPPVLVFVQSVDRARELEKQLQQAGVRTGAIHSDRTKSQRDRSIAAFSSGELWCLVSTEVMARGVDFKAVNMVINYDLPTSPVEYLHRIGRTGRNGRSGKAVTFFTSQDAPLVKPITNVMLNSNVEVPEYLRKMQNISKKEKKKLKRKPVERKSINEAAAQGFAAPAPGTNKRKRHGPASVKRARSDEEAGALSFDDGEGSEEAEDF